jgi:tetratricopeptide (TPR) repeat protein
MPKRSLTTIAHAALTDHSIPARTASATQPSTESHHDQKPELLVLTAPADKRKRLDSVPAKVLLEAYDSLVREGHQEFKPLLIQFLQKIGSSNSSDRGILRILARAEFNKNTPAGDRRALECMKRVLRMGTPNIDDYLFLSNLYVRTKQDREAVTILEKARSSSPYFREVYESLATEYMELGQYGDALTVLHQGIDLFPDDWTLRALEKKASSATLANP